MSCLNGVFFYFFFDCCLMPGAYFFLWFHVLFCFVLSKNCLLYYEFYRIDGSEYLVSNLIERQAGNFWDNFFRPQLMVDSLLLLFRFYNVVKEIWYFICSIFFSFLDFILLCPLFLFAFLLITFFFPSKFVNAHSYVIIVDDCVCVFIFFYWVSDFVCWQW